MSEILLDTNVLVYAYDRTEPIKQSQACEILDRLAKVGKGAISTQVLSEFFVTMIRKLKIPLSVSTAVTRLENHIQTWKILDSSAMVVLEAARGVRDHRMNFWDAQIWASARLHQIPLIFTEDFNTNAIAEGVRFVNPFTTDFSLDDWL